MNLFLKKYKKHIYSLSSIVKSNSGFIPLVAIIVVALFAVAVPATVLITQQEQDNRQLASEGVIGCGGEGADKRCREETGVSTAICADNKCYTSKRPDGFRTCGEPSDCAGGYCHKGTCFSKGNKCGGESCEADFQCKLSCNLQTGTCFGPSNCNSTASTNTPVPTSTPIPPTATLPIGCSSGTSCVGAGEQVKCEQGTQSTAGQSCINYKGSGALCCVLKSGVVNPTSTPVPPAGSTSTPIPNPNIPTSTPIVGRGGDPIPDNQTPDAPAPTAVPKPSAVTNAATAAYCVGEVKKFDVTWTPSNAISYNIKVNGINWDYDVTGGAFTGTIGDLIADNATVPVTISACNAGGCTDANTTLNTGLSCSVQLGCPNSPTSGGTNTCAASVQTCIDRGGAVFNNGDGNSACSNKYGASRGICCNNATTTTGLTPTATPSSQDSSCGQSGLACGPGNCCATGLNPNWSTGTCTCLPSSATTPAASTPEPVKPGGTIGQTCTPGNTKQGTCLSSNMQCVPNACNSNSFHCIGAQGQLYCPTTGAMQSTDSCFDCPKPTEGPVAGSGEICGGTEQCGAGLVCAYNYSLSKRQCCPSGTSFCDRIGTDGAQIGGCMTTSACKAAAGYGACEKANAHCYGNSSLCCSGRCVGTGSTAYCN